MSKLELFFAGIISGAIFGLSMLMVFVFHVSDIWSAVLVCACALLLLFFAGIHFHRLENGDVMRSDNVVLETAIYELIERVQKLEEEHENYDNTIRTVMSLINELEERRSSKRNNEAEDINHVQCVGKFPAEADDASAGVKLLTEQENVSLFRVQVELSEINAGNKNSPNFLNIYRDGEGAYFLIDNKRLYPAFFKEGDILTKKDADILSGYDMGELFEINSRELVDHKVVRIEPATVNIKLKGNIMEDQSEGFLSCKGKMEVENPVQ